MESLDKPIHAMVYGGERVYLEEVEFSGGGEYSSEAAAEGGMLHRFNGPKLTVITVRTHFQPSEMMFFSKLIREMSKSENVVQIDGWGYPNFILLEGRAALKADSFLGEFYLKLGVPVSYGED